MPEIGVIGSTATPAQGVAGIISLAVVILVMVLLVYVQARVERRHERRRRDAERRFAEAVARGDLEDAEAELQRVLSR